MMEPPTDVATPAAIVCAFTASGQGKKTHRYQTAGHLRCNLRTNAPPNDRRAAEPHDLPDHHSSAPRDNRINRKLTAKWERVSYVTPATATRQDVR